ncbi:MAG: helix-turn-helix transcriptional regulator [Bacilli bacterium]
MKESFGQRIARLRKAQGLTQEELGDKVNISSQAVSKWENDLSSPDISILVKLAGILGVSLDVLLGNEEEKDNPIVVPKEIRKDVSQLIFKIQVDSHEGDKVRINLPVSIIKIAVDSKMGLPNINGNEALKDIDWNQLFALIDQGVIGKLVEIESSDGDIVTIVVE